MGAPPTNVRTLLMFDIELTRPHVFFRMLPPAAAAVVAPAERDLGQTSRTFDMPPRDTPAAIASKASPPVEVLVIQSDPAGARSVQALLSGTPVGPFHVTWARSCADGVEHLRLAAATPRKGVEIAAVLVDLFLSDSQGVDTFNRIYAAAPLTPILILAPGAHEEVAKLAVQRGAQDYLLTERLTENLLPKVVGSMVERARIANTLFMEQDRARVTLNSIGDGVISSDVDGRITYLNAVAERMTGWTCQESMGRPLEEVLHIVDGKTRARIHNPLAVAMLENRVGGLVPDAVLIRRDGFEIALEDSVAPIHDRMGGIAGAVMVFRDVGAAREKFEQLDHQAHHDALTNLSNRFLLHDRLRQAITMAKRHVEKTAVLFVDVDHFKEINDRLGHEIGDRLLQSVAGRLSDSVRECDTVSRIGGDEFIVLLTEVATATDAAVSADRILVSIGAVHQIDAHELHVTASIGIALYPDDGDSAEALVSRADAAMYKVKAGGRNGYQFYGTEPLRQGQARSVSAA